jgi:uncharacterized protein YqeY
MKERITKELKDAMKSRDKLRTSVLRMLLADIINVEKSGKDFKPIDVVGSAMKIVMGKYKDVADGKKVQALVKKIFLK